MSTEITQESKIILERIKRFLGIKTDVQLASIMKVAQSTISTWKERNNLDWKLIFASCKEVSIDWLLTGEGPMKRDDIAESPSEFVHIPHYNVATSAGAGSMVESENVDKYLAFRSEWIHGTLRANPANLFILHVAGDSMTPTIVDGDTILVDKSQDKPVSGRIYVISVDHSLLVKRIRILPDGVLAVSDASDVYPPIRISGDGSSKVMGRVIWFGRVV